MKKMVNAFLLVGVLLGLTLWLQNNEATESANEAVKSEKGTDSAEEQTTSSSPAIPRVGFDAPDFKLMSLEKETFTVQQWKGDKPIVINFWASWCGPCRIETPDLIDLHKQFGDEVVFYGVNLTLGDNMDDVEAFVQEYNVTYPILLDITGDVSKEYFIQAVPTTYLIDRNGVVADRIIGIISHQELERRIQKLIKP